MSERPAQRRLVKLGFSLAGRSRAHWHEGWPGLALPERSEIVWKGRHVARLSPPPSFGNHPTIVGSGPSLRNQRLDQIGPAILVNGAIAVLSQVKPLAVVIEDERFIHRHFDMVEAVPRTVPLMLSPAVIRAVLSRKDSALDGRHITLVENIEKPFAKHRRSLADPSLRGIVLRGAKGAVSIKPQQGVVITGTVAFSALQFALADGPSSIRLAGIDLSNDTLPRFYEQSDKAGSGLSSGLTRILAGFATAQDLAKRRGIKLTCASPVSALLKLGIPLDESLT